MKRSHLRNARMSRRITALELAEGADSTEQHIYRLERGTAKLKVAEAKRIAGLLGFPVCTVFPEMLAEEAHQ